MEHKQIPSGPICDRLPPLSANYPWLVAQILEAEDDTRDQVFYTIRDLLSHYRCRIPELLGRRIRACFHGWVILSSNPHGVTWCLWNPVTSKTIHLPRLILKDGDYDEIKHCCLSSPPDEPGSILLLTRSRKSNIVFCRLDRKRKRLRWTEMSCAKQLRSIHGDRDGFLCRPVCCNGKVYACAQPYKGAGHVIQVDIVVKEKDVVIRLLPFVNFPKREWPLESNYLFNYLEGCCGELFTILVGFPDTTKGKPVEVYLYKLDMNSMMWAETKDLKDTVFFVDLADDLSVGCSPAIASESEQGYIHILHKMGKEIYSYQVKDKTISLHCLNLPPRSGALRTSHISVWVMPESRLQGDHGDEVEYKQDEIEMVVRSATNEADLLNIPFHVLERIMELCVGVEYLNFRATCKRCRLAAPVIQWGNGKTRRRLQTYSSVSPWLMVFDKDEGIITFTDPMFGDKYFIKPSPKLFFDSRILCSKYGWLLLFIEYQCVVFFNPFTGEIRELPQVRHLNNFCFSAPPTSPDCMVVGFAKTNIGNICVHFVAREPAHWDIEVLDLDGIDSHSFGFPIVCGRDVYTMFNGGGVDVFREFADNMNFSWELIKDPPRSGCRGAEYFQVKCDEHEILVVVVGEFGESVEVWKLNEEKEWEKMDGLGRHMIYICGTTCVCMDARTPEMENKIYFPRLHCGNGKIVFFSMETRRYHTFDGRNVGESFIDFSGTKHHTYAHAWIQPSWC